MFQEHVARGGRRVLVGGLQGFCPVEDKDQSRYEKHLNVILPGALKPSSTVLLLNIKNNG